MNRISLSLIISSLALISYVYAAESTSANIRLENYSHKKSLALSGYDPVTYFQEKPREGLKTISHTHEGITYHFASEKNLAAFKGEPEKYEPAYGGWCAWAMYADGGRTKANPESYKIVDGRLYVFYDGLFGDTLKLWNDELEKKVEAGMISQADDYWKKQLTETK